jgi:hypothetical protein
VGRISPSAPSGGSWYFAEQKHRDAFQAELPKWIGTPYLDGCGPRAKIGAAADCVSFPAAVLRSLGAIGAVPWPRRYVSIGGGAVMLQIIEETMANIPGLRRDWDHATKQTCPPLILGDLLLCSAGDRMHHLVLCESAVRGAHCWDGRVRWCSPADHPKLRWALYRCYVT